MSKIHRDFTNTIPGEVKEEVSESFNAAKIVKSDELQGSLSTVDSLGNSPFDLPKGMIEKAYKLILKECGKFKVYRDGRANFGRGAQRFSKIQDYLKIITRDNADLLPILAVDENFLHYQMYRYGETLPRDSRGFQRTKLGDGADSNHSYIPEDFYNFNWEGLIPFQSITDSNTYLIYDAIRNRITDYDYKVYKAAVDKEDKVPLLVARIGFNPYNPKPIWDMEDDYGRNCKYVNTYRKPSWQLDEELAVTGVNVYSKSLPPILDRFFQHLVPSKECREFLLDWLHFALTGRCETYLVLNGAKGIGKNLLSDHLCKLLMGSDNHKMAQPGALESNFNSLLEKSRMIVFDEFKIDTPDKVNKLKRYVNEEQMIEKKGQDVESTIKTYNSFIICNNDKSDMKISWDDRRFSVIDLTKVKLEDVWHHDEIEQIVDIDEEDLRHFGYFLMYRKPKIAKNSFSFWAGKHFYDLCYSSLPIWCQTIVDLADTREYEAIHMDDIKREMRKRDDKARVPKRNKIEDFLRNYKHQGEYYLGDCISMDGSLGQEWEIELRKPFKYEEKNTRFLEEIPKYVNGKNSEELLVIEDEIEEDDLLLNDGYDLLG